MIDRRSFLAVSALAAFSASAARAASPVGFDKAAFDAAMKEGKPVLIHVTAPWCPTCRAQKPIVGQLTAQPPYDAMTIFAVDFDSQKDILRAFGVTSQSTMIVFKGGKEVGREVGDTSPAGIKALFDQAV